jgi:hypothetical protein
MKTEDKLDLFGKEVSYDQTDVYDDNCLVRGYWKITYGSYDILINNCCSHEHHIIIYCNCIRFNTDKVPKPKNVEDMNKISADSTPKQVQQRVATILNWCIKNRERENEKAMEWAANKADWW